MELKDVKIGMKVRLLGKHAFDNYDDIEDFYDTFYNNERVQKIKEQGYGVVAGIKSGATEVRIIINNEIDEYKSGWYFLPSDLEPYEEEQNQQKDNTKSPKEWLLTPMAVCTVRNGGKFVTLSNERSPMLGCEDNWSRNLEGEYNEKLSYVFDYKNIESICDIVKIEYNGQVVWKRKEEKYYTLLEAIRTGKKIKYKNWQNFLEAQEVLNWAYIQQKEFVIEIISEAVWQVEE